MIVALAHPPVHDLLAVSAGVSHPDRAAAAVPAGAILLVALVLIVAVLLAAIGQVLDLLSEVLALLGTLVIGLILVIGIAAVGLSGHHIVPTAPPTTVVVAPPLPPRPHPHSTSKPGPTPSATRPRKPEPSQSPRSSLLTTGAPTFEAAPNHRVS
jgi:hypothetical protein